MVTVTASILQDARFPSGAKESHSNTDGCQVNNHANMHQRKQALLWVKGDKLSVNPGGDCKGWESFRHKKKRKAICVTVTRTVDCLLFVEGVGWFLWDVSRLGPLYTALSWSLSRGWGSPLPAGLALRHQANCHVNECFAGLYWALCPCKSDKQCSALYRSHWKGHFIPSPTTVVVLMFNSLIRKGSDPFP